MMPGGEVGPEGGGKVEGALKDEDASQAPGGTGGAGTRDGGMWPGEKEGAGSSWDGDELELEGDDAGVRGEAVDVDGESGGGEGAPGAEDEEIPFGAAEKGSGGSGEVGGEDGEDFEGDQEAAEAELDEDDLDHGGKGSEGGVAGAADGVRARADPRTQGLAPEGDARLSETLRVGLLGVEAQLSEVAGELSKHSAVVERLKEEPKAEKKSDAGEKVGEAFKELSESVDQTISAMVAAVDRQSEAFGGVNASVDVVKQVGEAISGVLEALRGCQADLSRQRELEGGVRRWTLLVAVALGGPALILAGTFAGQRWEVLPMQDATGGWRDHMWERYGGDLVGCVRRGLRDGSSFECVIDVRGSVEDVRARGSRR